jgi:hypothetical protein
MLNMDKGQKLYNMSKKANMSNMCNVQCAMYNVQYVPYVFVQYVKNVPYVKYVQEYRICLKPLFRSQNHSQENVLACWATFHERFVIFVLLSLLAGSAGVAAALVAGRAAGCGVVAATAPPLAARHRGRLRLALPSSSSWLLTRE